MRIALIAPPWIPVPPPTYGGTESVVDTLARGLSVAGHQVVLATTGDSTCPVDRRWIYERAMTDDLGSTVVEARHVLHAYDAIGDVDVIHDHTVFGPIYAERFPHRRVVTTNHGPFTDDLRAIYRAVSPRVPIIAISHHQASTASGVPIARVIHHGVDPSSFPIGDGSGGYLLFLGRMSPHKGVREAIEIARRTGARLLIAAKMREQIEREYFAGVIEPMLQNGIEYVGVVGGSAKLELLGGATALLNPLRWDEPFGLCMIEALACGTPVLVTPRGAAPEIVDDGITGFVRSSIDDLAAVVPAIPALDRHACRRAVETHFSAARMVAEHLALYEEQGACSRRRTHFSISTAMNAVVDASATTPI